MRYIRTEPAVKKLEVQQIDFCYPLETSAYLPKGQLVSLVGQSPDVF